MFEGLTFKEAAGPERERALELQNQVYTDDLGQVPTDPFDAHAHFLIAVTDGGDVVAQRKASSISLRLAVLSFTKPHPRARPEFLRRFIPAAVPSQLSLQVFETTPPRP